MLIKKAGFILGFFCITWSFLYCQQQVNLDSLELAYIKGNLKLKDKQNVLQELARNSTNPDKILAFSEALIQVAKVTDSLGYLYVGYYEKGTALKYKSNLSSALENYFLAAKIAKNPKQIGEVDIAIADIYSATNNHNNAVNYYQKAIAVLKKEKDSLNVANALYNLGDHYLKINQLDSALIFTKESQLLFNSIHDEVGEAYCLGNLGKIYSKSGNDLAGEANLDKAIGLLQGLNEFSAICEYLISMSDIYHDKKDNGKAKTYAVKSLELAQQYGLKKEISDANLKLSVLYEDAGDHVKSLIFYKEYIKYRDSVNNIQSVQQIADLRTDFEVSEKQKEVDLLETRNKLRSAERNGFVFASLLLAALLAASVYFYTQKVKRNKMLVAQKMQEAEIGHQKELLQSVITSQEAERKRIGMDLHDEVGAALSTLRIKIEKNSGDEKANEQAAGFKSDIDRIITNMRNISHSLSPRISGSFGFYDAVFELSDNVNRSGKINMLVNFDEDKLPEFADEQAPMAIYRVLSELINNTLKHASAKNIQLAVDVANDKMEIKYQDDGVGIIQKTGTENKGMGMQNIESRLGIIGAEWEVQNPENGGYGVFISVPLK
ncbi:MAG: tetratricopeptide repeat protein [Ferruginibacter sp.]|nr:tetratricopeptide repeat protein [Ferruginibacter sp.]